MTTESKFVRTQDRKYFNIHMPIRSSYDEGFVNQNNRISLAQSGLAPNSNVAPTRLPNDLPESEANRQMGSGKCNPMVGGGVSNRYVQARNNFDPSIPAPRNSVYNYLPQNQIHAPVKIHAKTPLQYGGSYAIHRHHGGATGESNPAINNWNPGTRINEPLRVYEYSTNSQIHSKIAHPAVVQHNIGGKQQGRLSSDDGKSFDSIQKYFSNPFGHVSHNPLMGHSA
jgi:hypothetical protein